MTNNELNKFLRISIICILILITIDQLIGFVIYKAYFNQTSGLYYRTTYAIDSVKADIIILGSSKANHHYIPEIISDSTGLSVYNAGRDGQGIFYNYFVFSSIIERYTPKYILFDLGFGDLENNQADYDKLALLYPYLKKKHKINFLDTLGMRKEKIKFLSAIYPYNSMLITIIKGNLSKEKSRDGYIPLYNSIKPNTKPEKLATLKNEIDPVKLSLIQTMINESIKRNIKLYLTVSPYYGICDTTESLQMLVAISSKNNIPLLSYINDTMYNNSPKLFSDTYHLNDEGARLFSSNIVKLLK